MAVFFNQMDLRLFYIQLLSVNVPDAGHLQFHGADIVYKILEYPKPRQHLLLFALDDDQFVMQILSSLVV